MSAWQTATITTLTLARVNGPMYTATSALWPDDTYPQPPAPRPERSGATAPP